MEKQRIYVDLDDTLIHAVWGRGRGVGKRSVVRVGEEETFHSLLRPTAKFLLSELRRSTEVLMLTTATLEYAKAHNDVFELGFLEKDIIARDHYIYTVRGAYGSQWETSQRGVCPSALLIDNLSPRSESSMVKMAYLGIGEESYIQIREFSGKDPENFKGELDEILHKVGAGAVYKSLATSRNKHQAGSPAVGREP
jgi:hypothetical protein